MSTISRLPIPSAISLMVSYVLFTTSSSLLPVFSEINFTTSITSGAISAISDFDCSLFAAKFLTADFSIRSAILLAIVDSLSFICAFISSLERLDALRISGFLPSLLS